MPFIRRIGLDPEVAIIDSMTGLGRSAHLFVKEKKSFNFYTDNDKAKARPRLGSEYERDGAAIEVRSVVESACRDNIVPYVAEALRQASFDTKAALGNNFALSSVPRFMLDQESLVKPPKDVIEFGCRPDIDAYALSPKDPLCEPGDVRRWTGGHIHASKVGAVNNTQQQAGWAILYDYLVALPMVAILGERFAEGEAERRTMYGQPGSFRFDDALDKIEFRTLSGRMLLHPTILYWIMGAMKMMFAQTETPLELVKSIQSAVPSEDVYDTVLTHDVEKAVALVNKVFKAMPKYEKTDRDLANPMSGSGGGTKNPYFFEMSTKVFIEGNKQGVTFDDDMQFNWGLYENYMPKHHAYWGIQQAMVKLLDDDIFPQNAVLPKVWPKGLLQAKPLWTHPLNGGSMQYVTPGAIGWLA